MDLSIIVPIIILVFIVFIIIFRKISKEGNQEEPTQEEREELLSRNIISEYPLIHLGGHPYLQVKDKVILQVKTNNTVYFQKENTTTGKEIPITDLIRYEIKTESEIQKDVTLTRLLALGIFAFGVKKKTKIEDQYLILSYIQNEVEVDCIFKRQFNYQQLGNIISKFNKIKIESN